MTRPAGPWLDAHLDLAYLAEVGREMRLPAGHLPDPMAPAAVTLPDLLAAGVTTVVGTVFTQPRHRAPGPDHADGPWCYDSPEEAHLAALRQVQVYFSWHREGWVQLAGLPQKSAPAVPGAPLRVVILIEGAAGLRTPRDLGTFANVGTRLVALTWAEGSPYAGGDHQPGTGISPAGRALVAEIDRLQMLHDVSHLAEQAFWELLDLAQRPVLATHSNVRSFLPRRKYAERHLSDAQIKALAARGGVIGINLFGRFLAEGRAATIDDVVRHVRHMTDLVGRADMIGLGSDMDGGFTADELPENLRGPRDLPRLAEALAAAGLSDEDVTGFMYRNLGVFLKKHLGALW
jgi:membrane dipeptidase